MHSYRKIQTRYTQSKKCVTLERLFPTLGSEVRLLNVQTAYKLINKNDHNCKLVQSLWQAIQMFLKKKKKKPELLHDPEIPFLGICPKEMKTLC